MGIEYEVRGMKNLPIDQPFVIASKHQSAWDTFIFNIIILNCSYVVKRELFWFPFFGWFLKRVGMISIDRSGNISAIKKLLSDCQNRLEAGRSIVIFPQGTRTAPGVSMPYLPGVAAIYTHCHVPVVPTALNSGVFWPRRTLMKKPGTIIVEFLPLIEPGLPRHTFAKRLKSMIEPATEKLEEVAYSTEVRPNNSFWGEKNPAVDNRSDK